MDTKKRNISLDILKCSACLAVVVLHVAGNNSNPINKFLYYFSSFAVPIFFVVNGCLMLNKQNITYKYIMKKVLGIVKVVFIWNIMITIALYVLGKGINNPIKSSLNNLIQEGYFWQFWFFGSLIIIYLFLPILHNVFKNNKTGVYITAIFIGISCIIDVISFIRAKNGYEIVQINIIQTFRIWTWFAYFLLGGLLGDEELGKNLKSKISFKINLNIVIGLSIIVVIYEYVISTFIYKIKFAEYFYDNIIMFIWIIAIFYLVDKIRYIKPKYLKFINLIGDNLIGVYIIHPTLIRVFYKLYKFDNSAENIILIVIVFILSLAISMLLSKIKFFRNMIRL